MFSDFIQNNRDIFDEILAYLPCAFVLQFVSKVFPRNPCEWNPAEYYAEHGNTNLLVWLKEINCFRNSPSVLRDAVKFGDIANIKLVPDYKKNKRLICECAAHDGHLHILQKYLQVEMLDGDYVTKLRTKRDVILMAVRGDHVHILKWMYEHNIHFSLCLYDQAAMYGSLSVIEWSHYIGHEPEPSAIHCAAMWGQLTSLKYMHDAGFPYVNNYLISDVMHCADLDVIKYVYYDMNCQDMGSISVHYLCGRCSVDVFNWLLEINYVWPDIIIKYMCESGKFNLVEWAYNAGLTCDLQKCREYCELIQGELIKWCYENAPCPFMTSLIIAV